MALKQAAKFQNNKIKTKTKMEDLKNWILKCGYTADGEEADEIVKILCKGRLKGTWNFFSKRVRMKNEVEIIRGNLTLQDAQNRRKHDVDETTDVYEANVLEKSLARLNKQIFQRDHEIKKLKTICFSLNAKKDDLRKKLLNSSAKNNQIIDHQEELNELLRKISHQTFEIEKWMTNNWEFAIKDRSDVLKMCSNFKTIVYKTLLDGSISSSQTDNCLIDSVNPDTVISGIIEATLKIGANVQVELNKSTSMKSNKENLEPLLEDLWNEHVVSYQNYQNTIRQVEIFNKELSRHLDQHLSNVQDERIKRYIKIKKALKAGYAFYNCLNKQLTSLNLETENDLKMKKLIADRYAIVEKQSKDMIGMKMLIEDLLGCTLNHREKVSHICDQIHLQRIDMVQTYGNELPKILDSNHGLASDALKGVHVDLTLNVISINRSGADSRILQFNPAIDIWKKSNFCHLLEHVLHTMQHNNLLAIYNNEMNKFKNFGHAISPEDTLKELLSNLLNENSTLCQLIQKKLKRDEGEDSRKFCEKFKKAVQTWATEPGKDAFIQGLNPRYKEKSLSDWYNSILK